MSPAARRRGASSRTCQRGQGDAEGGLDDVDSLRSACSGCTGVFSVQPAPLGDADSERRQAGNLIRAAKAAAVQHFVQASVSGTAQSISPVPRRHFIQGTACASTAATASFDEPAEPPRCRPGIELIDGVLIVTLNREEARNAGCLERFPKSPSQCRCRGKASRVAAPLIPREA
ncbi:NAD(P)H-binding protein [uncultured Mycobacterium sp.]|uniref:NAD(P)H-binding protein n=1 Tax=uncultured Mycobacterium sp. TaxID=171292 RepID=UPI0035CA24F0